MKIHQITSLKLELGNNEKLSLVDRFGNRKWSSQIQEGIAQGYEGVSGGTVVKNLSANTEDTGSITGSRRSPGGRNNNLL